MCQQFRAGSYEVEAICARAHERAEPNDAPEYMVTAAAAPEYVLGEVYKDNISHEGGLWVHVYHWPVEMGSMERPNFDMRYVYTFDAALDAIHEQHQLPIPPH